MNAGTIISYPQPKEEVERFATSMFEPVSKNLCVTGFFISGSGKRTFIKFLLREENILKNIFKDSYTKTLFVLVDPDEILDMTNEAYLKLILDSLLLRMKEKNLPVSQTSLQNPLLNIKSNTEALIEQGWHIVFILSDFEFTLHLASSIYRNLESILALNKKMVSYMFLSTSNLLEENHQLRFHNFKYAINRVTYYHPLLNKEIAYFVLQTIIKQTGYVLSEEQKRLIYDLAGGHAQLLKYMVTITHTAPPDIADSQKKLREYLLEYDQLQTVCSDIWNYLNEREKEIVMHVVKTGIIPKELQEYAQFLIKTHFLLPNKENVYSLFGDLFTSYIQKQIPQQKLTYDEKLDQIFYGSTPCNDRFTFQEFKLLVYLITNEGKVVSRDEVGQILWGKGYVEKYSDWSIDKLISSIRKKFDDMNFPSHKLTTLKKRGFMFSNQ